MTEESVSPIQNLNDLKWTDFSQGERFALRFKTLSDSRKDGAKLAIHFEELPPGKQSCPRHYHQVEEEFVWILEGSCTLLWGEEKLPIREGDYARFPAGDTHAHALLNEGEAVCRYLILGNPSPQDAIVYPDSNKVMVRATQEIYPRQPMTYWEGED